MLALCDRAQTTAARHFFYGGVPGAADLLAHKLQARYPGLVVAGTHASSFQPADQEEDSGRARRHQRVGSGHRLGRRWVHRNRITGWLVIAALLTAPVLIAVGAAFDFHAGLLKQAPRWMQRNGLEWLFRLFQEPRRLAYRYLVYNPLFVFRVALQLSGIRRYAFDERTAGY